MKKNKLALLICFATYCLMTTDIEADERLNRPNPKRQPRLTDKEAAELLASRGKRDVRVHDPSSIVKCGDEYWFFSTGYR